MKHRYIFCGVVHGTDKISDFRLISSCTWDPLGYCVRVNIPDDLKLNHFNGDCYSTTNDERTLDELGWDCIFYFNRKWRKFNALKEYEPHEWHDVLEYIYGLYDCFGEIGWTDDKEEYLKWQRQFYHDHRVKYNPYKEMKELSLDINLKKYPFQDDSSSKWYVKYMQLKEEERKRIDEETDRELREFIPKNMLTAEEFKTAEEIAEESGIKCVQYIHSRIPKEGLKIAKGYFDLYLDKRNYGRV